ncbi:MAG: hypothetical protein ACI935_001198 [Moritella dasanensis]
MVKKAKEAILVYGVFQDSWHSLVNFYAASFTGFSGFNVTSPIASQF